MNILYTLIVGTVYIFNSEGMYLNIGTDGTPTLSKTPVALNLTKVDEKAEAGRVSIDGDDAKWVIKHSADDKYTVGYHMNDAYTTAFIYTQSGKMATSFEEPATTFPTGQWTVSTNRGTQSITLDENVAYTRPTFTKDQADVTLKRTLVAKEWNTLCLPFPIDASTIKSVWGNGTMVAKLSGDTDTKLLFTTCDEIEAGVPYVLQPERVSEDKTYQFDGIDVSTWDNEDKSHEYTAGSTKFVGFYSSTTVPANSYVFGDGNKMYLLKNDMDAMGYRGYFKDVNATIDTPRNLTWLINGTPTSINNPEVNAPGTAKGNVYNANGQLVRRNATAAGLAPGLYIVNGIKIIVK